MCTLLCWTSLFVLYCIHHKLNLHFFFIRGLYSRRLVSLELLYQQPAIAFLQAVAYDGLQARRQTQELLTGMISFSLGCNVVWCTHNASCSKSRHLWLFLHHPCNHVMVFPHHCITWNTISNTRLVLKSSVRPVLAQAWVLYPTVHLMLELQAHHSSFPFSSTLSFPVSSANLSAESGATSLPGSVASVASSPPASSPSSSVFLLTASSKHFLNSWAPAHEQQPVCQPQTSCERANCSKHGRWQRPCGCSEKVSSLWRDSLSTEAKRMQNSSGFCTSSAKSTADHTHAFSLPECSWSLVLGITASRSTSLGRLP